jgi:hypothetical protein
MEHNRAEVMKKARAKRLRREQTKMARKKPRAAQHSPTNTATGLTEKVIDLAQGASRQVGEIVKDAARKIAGALG